VARPPAPRSSWDSWFDRFLCMPRSNDVASLVSEFTSRIEGLIDRTVAERLDHALAEFRSTALAPRIPQPRATRPQRVLRAAPRRAVPAPRPLAELPKPMAATVIPPSVKITRLPPGPVPRASTYSKLRAQCRLPGCLTRNSGPRFDFFCRDHYAALRREEREKYKAQWKAAHAA